MYDISRRTYTPFRFLLLIPSLIIAPLLLMPTHSDIRAFEAKVTIRVGGLKIQVLKN